MRLPSLLSLVLALAASHAMAVEISPRPGGPGRLLMTYEIEVVTVKPDDAASVAAWTELAALGYHVVATSPKADGSAVLYLERMGTPGTVQVPALLNANPASVEELRTRIKERQQTMRSAAPATGAPVQR